MPETAYIQSLLRGLSILERAAESDEGLSIKEIGAHLEVGAPTAHNLARTLVYAGYLEKSGQPPRYRLGGAAMDLAEKHCALTLHRQAEKTLKGLAKRLPDAIATFCVPIGGEVLTVLRIDPQRPRIVERPQGKTVHAYGTASGLVHQAFWPPEDIAAYRDRYPFWEYGAHLWKTEKQLEVILEETRTRGYAAPDLGDTGVHPVAAPVYGKDKAPRGMIGLVFKAKSVPAAKRKQQIAAVKDAAKEISRGE